MSRIPIVVGLDYHSQNVQVAIMRASHHPELLANENLPNDACAIVQFAERFGKVVKLTLTHEGFVEGGKMLDGISKGWPAILASLKSLLETGEPLTIPLSALGIEGVG